MSRVSARSKKEIPPRPKWNSSARIQTQTSLKLHEQWMERNSPRRKNDNAVDRTATTRGSFGRMASDNYLKNHLASGTSRRQPMSQSSGTLKAVKSLKAQLSRINHN